MLLTSLSLAAVLGQGPDPDSIAWWRAARFGMFVHWGLYSIPAGRWEGKDYPGASEWLLNTAQIKVKDYEPLQKQFNPVKFNARQWARIAKGAGMKYLVITSKHHDGFCLWDSAHTDWDIMGTPFKRFILKELAAACKAEGIKLGFYHSIMDWHHPHYGQRRAWDPRPEAGRVNMDLYTQYMKAQLKELLTGYGDLVTVWFDGEWEDPWTAARGKDLYEFVKSLQPKTLVNNRVDKGRSGMAGMTQGDHRGDYGTPEQEVPARGLPGVDWESCMTMNWSWGYHATDTSWKSPATLIGTLVETASKGGNFLLNVGPTSEGLIPAASVERLAEMGRWLKTNGRAIYGTQASPFGRSPYRWTRKGSSLYVFLPDWKQGSLTLDGILSPIASVKALGGGPQTFRQTGGRLVVDLSGKAPSEILSVLEINCRGKVLTEDPKITPTGKGVLELPAALADIKGDTLRHEGAWLGFWTKAEDSASWQFDGLPAGKYRVELDYALEGPSAGSVGLIEIGGQKLEFTPQATGGWQLFRTMDAGTVSLPAGTAVLTVRPKKMAGALVNLRAVRLIPA